jgi:hypothetical protein
MPAVSGSTTQVKTSATTAADLAGTPDDAFQEGDLACVSDLWPNSTFRLRRTALGSAPDNVSTIAAFSGNGYWEVFGSGGGSMLSFATIGLLAAYNDLALGDGALVYVESVRSYWSKIVEADPGTANGITIVRNLDNTATWYRDSSASLSWQQTVYWEIAPAPAGDDENTGGAGDPLATFAEFARRLPVLNSDVSVIFTEDTTEDLVGDFEATGLYTLTLSGGTTPLLASGLIDTITAPAIATNDRGTLVVDDGGVPVDWTTIDPTGYKVFVEVIATGLAQVPVLPPYKTIAVFGSVGATTGYTPFWSHADTIAVLPIVGDTVRITKPVSVSSINVSAKSLNVDCQYLQLSDGSKLNYVQATGLVAFRACIMDSVFESITDRTDFRSCTFDTDAELGLIGGDIGRIIMLGCAHIGHMGVNSRAGRICNGTIVHEGRVSVSGADSSATASVADLRIIGSGLGIFGDGTAIGLHVNGGFVRVTGNLYGDSHLVGASVERGGAIVFSGSAASNPAVLNLTGGTEVELSAPDGVVAGEVVPVVAGVPLAASTAAMATWAAWIAGPFNSSAVNFADLSRITAL